MEGQISCSPETPLARPVSPYGICKMAQQLYVEALCSSFGVVLQDRCHPVFQSFWVSRVAWLCKPCRLHGTVTWRNCRLG